MFLHFFINFDLSVDGHETGLKSRLVVLKLPFLCVCERLNQILRDEGGDLIASMAIENTKYAAFIARWEVDFLAQVSIFLGLAPTLHAAGAPFA